MADRPDERLTPATGGGIGPAPSPRAAPEGRDDAPAPPTEFLLPRTVRRADSARCPFCMAVMEVYLYGLTSGIGPALLECPGCGRPLLSRRGEWAEMGRARKAWFLAASIVYTAVLAGLATALTAFAFFLVRARPSLLVFTLHAAGWAAAVAAVQWWRVVRSLRRTRMPERKPYRPSRWSSDLGWTLRFLAGVVATSAALAWLAHVLKW